MLIQPPPGGTARKEKRRDHENRAAEGLQTDAAGLESAGCTVPGYFIIDCAALDSVWSSLPSRFESALLKALDSPRIFAASRLSM